MKNNISKFAVLACVACFALSSQSEAAPHGAPCFGKPAPKAAHIHKPGDRHDAKPVHRPEMKGMPVRDMKPGPDMKRPVPAPGVKAPVPAPGMKRPVPAPGVKAPVPDPGMKRPVPAPGVKAPVPAPGMKRPVPGPGVKFDHKPAKPMSRR